MNTDELTQEIAPELPANGEDHGTYPLLNDTGIEPLGDRILIRRIAERETAGSIAIPEAHREKPVEGIVLAVGPGRTEGRYIVPPRTPLGARVMFGRYAGVDLADECGPGLLMCRDDEIMAVRR